MWQETLAGQNLKNDIQIMETKLCHTESRLKDKLLEIEELRKLLASAELKLEQMRSKYEAAAQTNARVETETTNLRLYNDSPKANLVEHMDS